MQPASPAPHAPQKKSTSGCLTGILVVGGVGLVVLIVVVVVVVRFFSTPEGKKIAGAVGQSARMIQKASNAPGTHELREAGCSQAAVLDPEDVHAMVEALVDDAGAEPSGPDHTMIVCKGTLRGEPTCDTVAGVYARAVPGGGRPLDVEVQSVSGKRVCHGVYGADGARLR